MDMDLRQLQVFQAVMEFRSVSRAARALGVSQPAVSALIKRLERQIGIALFRRDTRRLEPTAEALLLTEHVGQALEGISKVRGAINDIRHAGAGMLTIAAHPTSSISWLPPFVAAFQAKRPAVRLRLITRNSDMLRENAATYAADITISETPVSPSSSQARRYRFRCVLALPVGHPLCEQEVITPQDASPYPFIALSRWQTTHYRVARAFDEAGVPWNIAVECELFSTALLLVANGAGITVAEPVSAAAFAVDGKIVIRKFEPEIRYEVALLLPEKRSLPILGTTFIREFDEYLAPYLVS